MADVAIAIREYLLTKTAITDLIDDRIYTDIVEQGATLPAVSMSKLSTRHDHTLSSLAGLAHCRMQFDCFSDSRAEANAIAETIYLSGVAAIKGVYSSVDIRGVRLEEGQRNEIDYANDDSDDHRYVTSFDLEIDYTETI